ncbi:MAG: efflux RND transporter periplasmic adaptor subunit [Methylobacter sp.]
MQKNSHPLFSMNPKLITIMFILGSGYVAALQAAETTELDCMVKPEMYVELSSPVDGVLESVLVETSDSVQKGQVLAKLESSVETAQVNLSKQEASVIDVIEGKRIESEFSKRNKDRFDQLYKKQAGSWADDDKANTEANLTRLALNKAISDKKIAELKFKLATAQLEQKSIKSPITGIVIERYAMPGETVENRPIMKLAQIDPLRVELVAPAALFGQISKGMSAEIHPEKPANQTYQATVTTVDKLIDPASGSFTVRLALPNPNDKLVGGVNCVAKFNFPSELSTANTKKTAAESSSSKPHN